MPERAEPPRSRWPLPPEGAQPFLGRPCEGLAVARSELVLGGQGSGKTRRAESLAAAWLAQSAQHEAVFIATAQAWDDEMRERLARSRRDRSERVPRMQTVEEPLAVAQALGANGSARTLVVVDCLTLWLTAVLMRAVVEGGAPPSTTLSAAIRACAGPIVLVSNEVGLDAAAMGRDARQFVHALTGLNQQAAAACERVTLMSAGLAMTLKGAG